MVSAAHFPKLTSNITTPTREPVLFSGAKDHSCSGNLPTAHFRHTLHQKTKIQQFPYMGSFASCVVSGQPLHKLELGDFTLPLIWVQSEALEIPTETHLSPLVHVSPQQDLGSSTSWGFY